jgi:hypothetical protein
MLKKAAGALLLATSLLIPQLSSAEVFMCVDPATGKKTFTAKACPTAGERKKVKVQPTNFGSGTQNRTAGTWSSDKDRSVSGRDNLGSKANHLAATQSTDRIH